MNGYRLLSKVVSGQLPDDVILLRHLATETDFAVRLIQGILYTPDLELPSGNVFGFDDDPNGANETGSEGEILLYHAKAGTRYIQKGTAAYQIWIKIDDDPGGRWERDAFLSDVIAATSQGILSIAFSWGDFAVDKLFIGTIPNAAVITDVLIKVKEEFDLPAVCSVGDESTAGLYFEESDCRLNRERLWSVEPYEKIFGATDIYLHLTGTPTQGLADVFVQYIMYAP